MTIFANARHDKFLVATLALFQIWVCVLFSANAARNMIVYSPTMQDRARTLFFQESQPAPMLVSAANASVSVANDTDANAGVFGTDVENFGSQGRRSAGIAVNIVNGGRPGIPFVRDADIYLFDRRALKRRALEKIDVPAESVVTDEQPAIWQAFRQIMIPGIVLLFAQGLIIILLLRQSKRAKEQKRISENQFQQFFETIPEYCFIASPDGEILDANPAACHALGYAKDEILGKPLSAIYASETFSRITDLLEKWKRTGTLRNEELVVLTKNGEKRHLLLNAGALLDAAGNLLLWASVQNNTTPLKKVQRPFHATHISLFTTIPRPPYPHLPPHPSP